MEPFNVLRRILKSLRTMEPNKVWYGTTDSSSCRVISRLPFKPFPLDGVDKFQSFIPTPRQELPWGSSRVARERAEEEEEELGVTVSFVVPVPGSGDSPLAA